MTRYLLDTNIVSDLVVNPQGRAAKRLRKVGETKVCTSVIVASELRYGAAKRGFARLNHHLHLVLGALEVVALDAPADEIYATIREARERRQADWRQ